MENIIATFAKKKLNSHGKLLSIIISDLASDNIIRTIILIPIFIKHA